MRALNGTWQEMGRETGQEREASDAPGEVRPAPPEPRDSEPAERLKRARQRVWVADTACYYAHRRYQQSGSVADREAWEARRRECDEAVEALRLAERRQAHIPGR